MVSLLTRSVFYTFSFSAQDNAAIVPRKNVHLEAKQVWCCNCARRGHFVHQCRGYSYSCIPPLVPSVVSYKETRPFFKNATSSSVKPKSEIILSKSAKKRKLREELKASKRAYQSLPNTPKNRHTRFSNSLESSPKRSRYHRDGCTDQVLEDLYKWKKYGGKKKGGKKWALKVHMESPSPQFEVGNLKKDLKEKLKRSGKIQTFEGKMVKKKMARALNKLNKNNQGAIGAKKRKKIENLLSRI